MWFNFLNIHSLTSAMIIKSPNSSVIFLASETRGNHHSSVNNSCVKLCKYNTFYKRHKMFIKLYGNINIT